MISKGNVRAIAVAVSLTLAHASATAGQQYPSDAVSGKLSHPNAIIGGDTNAIIGGDTDAIIGGDLNAIIGGDTNAIIGGDLNAIIGGDTNAIIGGDTNAIIGGDTNAIIGGDTNAIIGGDTNAIIGGDTNAIIGGDLNAIIGGDTNAIIGGDTNAIIGGDTDAIIGGDLNAIIGGDTDAIIGGDLNAIIGGDTDAVSGVDMNAMVSADLLSQVAAGVVAYGPIESIDVVKGRIRVLGQTYQSQPNSPALQVLNGQIVGGTVVLATITGKVSRKGGTPRAQSMAFSDEIYVPGATHVQVLGKVDQVSPGLGTFKVGGLIVDYTTLLAQGQFAVEAGQIVAISGVQSGAGLPLQAVAIVSP
jgi:hypothetical protein